MSPWYFRTLLACLATKALMPFAFCAFLYGYFRTEGFGIPCFGASSSCCAQASLKAHHGGAAIGATQGTRNREIRVAGSGCRVLGLKLSEVG